MSPKKKRKGSSRRPQGAATEEMTRAPSPLPGRAEPSSRRTPYVVDGPSRWPVLVWTALALVWVVGVPMFLLFFLAEGFALQAEEVTDEARRRLAGYLLGLLVCAVVVPLGGLGAALWSRRKIAAWMFGGLTAVSLAAMWTLMPPWQLVTAIWDGFTG
ncbi:hypothetical protein J4H86_08345 [Spiractinospora alimapuensis]|uniref:hypothetical protein n=1 Tax=Spiractinospora alimapuensis TaxID=2820884 RepID=UPI001F436153|nr:hypothetical protein [Spiractinospora alimapuensis]QVQ53715.1 hypothetical protein J4H86_08345 [Spiractinospora alimapuensis]